MLRTSAPGNVHLGKQRGIREDEEGENFVNSGKESDSDHNENSPIAMGHIEYNAKTDSPIRHAVPMRSSRVKYLTGSNVGSPFNFPVIDEDEISEVALAIDSLPPLEPDLEMEEEMEEEMVPETKSEPRPVSIRRVKTSNDIPKNFPPPLPPLERVTATTGDPDDLKFYMNLKLCHQMWDAALIRYRKFEAENNKEAMQEVCRQLCDDLDKIRPVAKSPASLKDSDDYSLTLQICNLPKLNLHDKALLLTNMLKMNEYLEEDILSIISSVDNREFWRFKTAIDNTSDYFNVYTLYYRILDDNGKTLFKDKSINSTTDSELETNIKPIKILSDLDDTLVCSGGSAGNVDTRYPKDIIYPGITTFYKELDIGPMESDGKWSKEYGNLVFVSARPHVNGTTQVEMLTYRAFQSYYNKKKLHCYPTLLTGNMRGIAGALQKNFTEMARKKSRNVSRYMYLYPEYDAIFIGDNGQGDVLAALNMLSASHFKLKMAFIHRVQDEKKTFGVSDPTAFENIFLFDTYVGAAIHAFQKHFLTIAGLERVLEAAKEEFINIPWTSQHQRKKALQAFQHDCSKAEELIELYRFL